MWNRAVTGFDWNVLETIVGFPFCLALILVALKLRETHRVITRLKMLWKYPFKNRRGRNPLWNLGCYCVACAVRIVCRKQCIDLDYAMLRKSKPIVSICIGNECNWYDNDFIFRWTYYVNVNLKKKAKRSGKYQELYSNQSLPFCQIMKKICCGVRLCKRSVDDKACVFASQCIPDHSSLKIEEDVFKTTIL